MDLFLLADDTVRELFLGNPDLVRRLDATPLQHLGISAITAAELHDSVIRHRTELHLRRAVDAFLKLVAVHPWDAFAAKNYGQLRRHLPGESGRVHGLDLLVAAQAVSLDAILLTRRRAFIAVPGLLTEDWTLPEIDTPMRRRGRVLRASLLASVATDAELAMGSALNDHPFCGFAEDAPG